MNDDRSIELLRMRAEACIDRNDLDGAIDLFEQILAIDPTLGDVHASLALCLVDRRLVDVARAEAELAMSLDPDQAVCHRAMAHVLLAEGQRRAALDALATARELEPEFAQVYVTISAIERMLGQDGEAALRRALELEPEDPSVLAAWSEFERERGDLDEAEAKAREALEFDAEHAEAILALGWVLMQRGRLDEARDLAATALRQDPGDADALRLLASCRARKSLVLGLWFRFNMKLAQLGEGKSIAVMLGAYVVVRILYLVLIDLGHEQAAQVVLIAWLVVCVYTWIGPGLFRRMLQREIGELELDPDY